MSLYQKAYIIKIDETHHDHGWELAVKQRK